MDRQATRFFTRWPMVEAYPDRFLVPRIYVMTNFVKIVGAILKVYESCVHGQTGNSIFYKMAYG